MEKKIIRIAPSLLAADFTNLDKEVKKIIVGKADWLHLDIMDGSFVPNISFGIPVCEALKDYPIFKDVHLMISNPEKYIDRFIQCNADLITFHIESVKGKKKTNEIIKMITDNDVACGISIKPNTPVETIIPFLKKIDLVLIMSVEPGFGGQKYMDSATNKIKELRKIIDDNGYECLIEVDGGINEQTSLIVKEAGADVLVAGSYIFKSENIRKTIKNLKK